MRKVSHAADWFKADARAIIAATRRMPPLAFAAWTTLRAEAWLLGGTLPVDDVDLQRLSGLDRRQWVACREKVLREFDRLSDGASDVYSVPDLATQITELREVLDKRVKAGRASADARGEAVKSQRVLDALDQHREAGDRLKTSIRVPAANPLKSNDDSATGVVLEYRNKSEAKASHPPYPQQAAEPSPSPVMLPATARPRLDLPRYRKDQLYAGKWRLAIEWLEQQAETLPPSDLAAILARYKVILDMDAKRSDEVAARVATLRQKAANESPAQ